MHDSRDTAKKGISRGIVHWSNREDLEEINGKDEDRRKETFQRCGSVRLGGSGGERTTRSGQNAKTGGSSKRSPKQAVIFKGLICHDCIMHFC
jgi:hypothetical protein